jgi:5-hydroxyisourate hydrolase
MGKTEGVMGWLSTHVLDTALGVPAAGMRVILYRVTGNSHKKLGEFVTNADGRVEGPLLEGKAFSAGTYELVFCAGGYLQDSAFLDEVPVRFAVADAGAHYHVPLLLSPFGYSTYRGS